MPKSEYQKSYDSIADKLEGKERDKFADSVMVLNDKSNYSKEAIREANDEAKKRHWEHR